MSDTNLILASKSYFTRHWRGELPLPVSYWLNGFLLSIILAALARRLESLFDISSHPQAYSVCLIVIWILLITITPWQLIGTWRSASDYVAKNKKKRIWGILAKISVLIGATQSIYLIFTQGIPQLTAYWDIARGDHTYGEYELRLLRNNSELEISGTIRFGLTQDVKKTLNAYPTITTLHLNSEGGRIAEARKLRDLIESRKLATFTSIGCSSACIIPYAAGTQRLIGRNARLGFHQYQFPGVDAQYFKNEYAKDKSYLLSKGVDNNFIDKAFSTPPTDLWKPSYEELYKAKMVSGYADMDQVALSGVKLSEIETIEQTVFNTPFYEILKKYEPEIYQQLLSEMKEAFKKGLSQGELRQKVQPIIQKAYIRRLPSASDQALHDFILMLLDQMETLKIKDPLICYDFIFDSNKPIDVYKFFTKELIGRELSIMEEVIRSSATDQLKPPTQEHVQAQLAAVFTQVSKEFNTDINLINTKTPNDEEKKKICFITYSLYKKISTLPKNEAGDLLRFMMGNANK